jgi:hypothetical protein
MSNLLYMGPAHFSIFIARVLSRKIGGVVISIMLCLATSMKSSPYASIKNSVAVSSDFCSHQESVLYCCQYLHPAVSLHYPNLEEFSSIHVAIMMIDRCTYLMTVWCVRVVVLWSCRACRTCIVLSSSTSNSFSSLLVGMIMVCVCAY